MPLFAISGSQGTGKSTLLSALSYPQITRKTSRSILTDWGVTLSQVNNDRTLTIRFQEEILLRKLDDERLAVGSTEVYFTERTFADLFVYALVAIGKDNEHSDWLDEYYERCLTAQSTYAHVYYLSAGLFAPVHDGVRGTNQHYSRLVDLAMLDYTDRMSPHVTPISIRSLSDRVDFITDHVRHTQR